MVMCAGKTSRPMGNVYDCVPAATALAKLGPVIQPLSHVIALDEGFVTRKTPGSGVASLPALRKSVPVTSASAAVAETDTPLLLSIVRLPYVRWPSVCAASPAKYA